jgi:uncharacterized protein YjbI with pentapeptide repeats
MMREAVMSGAAFVGAELVGLSAIEADFSLASFRGADLRGAFLCAADLERAWFVDANLDQADLGCRYEKDEKTMRTPGANVSGADFKGASLRSALLLGTDLSKAEGLSEADLDGVETDERTAFPAYLRR